MMHKRMVHMKEKPFSCNQCSYKCIFRSKLFLHKLTHSGEKPFACNECFYVTIWKSNLCKHKLTKHS